MWGVPAALGVICVLTGFSLTAGSPGSPNGLICVGSGAWSAWMTDSRFCRRRAITPCLCRRHGRVTPGHLPWPPCCSGRSSRWRWPRTRSWQDRSPVARLPRLAALSSLWRSAW
jgi:hypothetical protein